MNKTYLEVLDELKKLKKAFVDILDGNSSWYEIRYNTGLPKERCEEIHAIFAGIIAEKERKEAGKARACARSVATVSPTRSGATNRPR
jgi:hypothetical protein